MENINITIDPPLVCPGEPDLPWLLGEGLAHHLENRLDEAEHFYMEYFQEHPEYPQVPAFPTALLTQKKHSKPAEKLLRESIYRSGQLADPIYSLDYVPIAQGELEDAHAAPLKRPCVAERPERLIIALENNARARSYSILANFLLAKGQSIHDPQCAHAAIRLGPNALPNWLTFSQSLARIRSNSPPGPEILADIEQFFNHTNLDYRLNLRATTVR